uniref:Uncharacterized protein n=1 Tax=Chelonoidis abingdonii TaxID=106734 RepID=A0A8C0H6Y2_CHEAB
VLKARLDKALVGPDASAPLYSTYPYTGPAQGFPVQPPPRDFVLWSLFNTFFCNVCCLGFMALVFSFKARDRKVLGDSNGAESYGKTAKCLNITVLGEFLTLLCFLHPKSRMSGFQSL